MNATVPTNIHFPLIPREQTILGAMYMHVCVCAPSRMIDSLGRSVLHQKILAKAHKPPSLLLCCAVHTTICRPVNVLLLLV